MRSSQNHDGFFFFTGRETMMKKLLTMMGEFVWREFGPEG